MNFEIIKKKKRSRSSLALLRGMSLFLSPLYFNVKWTPVVISPRSSTEHHRWGLLLGLAHIER
jgi:hypothetical protein